MFDPFTYEHLGWLVAGLVALACLTSLIGAALARLLLESKRRTPELSPGEALVIGDVLYVIGQESAYAQEMMPVLCRYVGIPYPPQPAPDESGSDLVP